MVPKIGTMVQFTLPARVVALDCATAGGPFVTVELSYRPAPENPIQRPRIWLHIDVVKEILTEEGLTKLIEDAYAEADVSESRFDPIPPATPEEIEFIEKFWSEYRNLDQATQKGLLAWRRDMEKPKTRKEPE